MKKSEQPQRMNILLVEDNEHDRAAFHRAFRGVEYDCSITDCTRAPEAVAIIEADQSAFDVVVVDHHLPCQYGLDLCKELLAAAVPLPLVILTGSGSEQVAVAALKAGVDDYIIKDPDSAYLQILPMVLAEVAFTFRGRIAHMAAETSLHESRERLSNIIEGLTVPTFVIDADHITTHWNLACEKITGVPAREVIGTRQQWRAFYPSERPVMADLIVDRVIEEEIAHHYAGKYLRSEVLEGAFEAEDFFPHLGEGGKWLFFTAAPLKEADEEFIVIFPETEAAEARIVAERLRQAFEETVFTPVPGEEARATISIGGGSYRPEEGLAVFVKRVDEAMYRAKKCGKNRVVFV